MKLKTIKNLNILNPKRKLEIENSFYPYYAGFSQEFAEALIASTQLNKKCQVFDPWNGSGTTTTSASLLGYNCMGLDLNPVMIIAARANLLDYNERPSIKSLLLEICKKARRYCSDDLVLEKDPLCTWIIPKSAENIRRIEKAIRKLLISNSDYTLLKSSEVVEISNIASFFYVALFRSFRELLTGYGTSNPTWIKKPKELNSRLRPTLDSIIEIFHRQVEDMLSSENHAQSGVFGKVDLKIGSSTKMEILDSSVDYVLTSPPYCTRIDYAVATMPELAIIGFGKERFEELRKLLIGTPTVPDLVPEISPAWGSYCVDFLHQVYEHSSKASRTYYFKNHAQYFDSMYKSISEISRVMKPGGFATLVVQDSFYKDVHNDLAEICSEMACFNGLDLTRRVDFPVNQNMVGINSASKKYRDTTQATESVLCFIKE